MAEDAADAAAPAGGADATAADPVLVWSLASFHTTTLLVAPLALLYAVGALGSLLQGVRTATGLGLYLALWGLTWWTNRRWLARTRLDGAREAVVPGAKWGAVTGVGFLFVLLVVVGVSVGEPILVAVLVLVGTPVAALVGGLVGAGFAVLDLLVVAAGRGLATAS